MKKEQKFNNILIKYAMKKIFVDDSFEDILKDLEQCSLKYNKAKRLMKQRCLTEENKHKARENAIDQVEKMVMSLGVKNVRVK